MHNNQDKVAAHNMAGSSARLTDALAATNEDDSASRDLDSQPLLKARVCRYFSKSGICISPLLSWIMNIFIGEEEDE